MLLQHILLLLLWTGFYALHSFLAYNSTKKYFQQLLQKQFRFYRLGFNVISVIYFGAIIYYQFSITTVHVFSENLITKIIGATIFFSGLIILLIAFKSFNLAEFFGIEQMNENVKQQKNNQPQLIKTGLYKYVRHPLYFGIIVMLSGGIILLPMYSTLVFITATLLYLPVGVGLEEEKLITEFGEQYLQYKKEVKMLIPFLY